MITTEIESCLNTSNFLISDKYSVHDAVLRVVSQVENDLIYNGNTFYEWKDTHWDVVPEIMIDRLGAHLLKAWSGGKANDFRRLLGVYTDQEVNKNPLAVHLENYVYDLGEMVLMPPIEYKHDYMIGKLPISYVPDARCDRWMQFMHEVMRGKQDKINLVQEFFGYCLLGDNRYQQALVLLGSGNNGKSVLLEILAALFDKVTYLDLKQIEDERYVHHIQGAWLNVASELAYKSIESTAYIKACIAGEMIQAAPKYHKGFSFRPRAKIAFATNGLPRNNDTSQGYFRRLLIINMDYTVEKPNRNLVPELKREIPGIFLWAIDGLKRLMKRGKFDYENPYIELYKEESSSLYAFWVDGGFHAMQIEREMEFSDFYNRYVAYCSQGGMRPAGRNKIRSELERLQIPVVIFTSNLNIKMVKLV